MFVAMFPAIVIFSGGVMAWLGSLAWAAKSAKPGNVVIFASVGLAGAFQLYSWGLWSAFCVAQAIHFMNRPEVTMHWAYWIAALALSVGPLGWFSSRGQPAAAAESTPHPSPGATAFSLAAIAAFLLFAFVHGAMGPPYGWA